MNTPIGDPYPLPTQLNISIKYGWECPKCSAVMSPTTPCCFYCKPKISQTITSVGTSQSIKQQCIHGIQMPNTCDKCFILTTHCY